MSSPVVVSVISVVLVLYLAVELTDLYFLSQPPIWIDPAQLDPVDDEHLPDVVHIYQVEHESEQVVRRIVGMLVAVDYPADRDHIVVVVSHDNGEAVRWAHRLGAEYPSTEVLVVPPTSDPSWDGVWEAWDREPKAYWWHAGPAAGVRDLPAHLSGPLVFAFYNTVATRGDGWILDFIDSGKLVPADRIRQAAAGFQHFDVLYGTTIAGNLLETWPASWLAMDHMVWDGFMFSHLDSKGNQPYWVLGKNLFYMASDLVALGGFNPWLAIEEPEIGIRLWKNGRRLGVLADPVVKQVPLTLGSGIEERGRWVCGLLRTLARPLTDMGLTFPERMRARINLLPCLSLILNPIGVPVSVWVLLVYLTGARQPSLPLVGISILTLCLCGLIMAFIYFNTWHQTGSVLSSTRDRLHYMVRISPPFLFMFWIGWIAPTGVGLVRFYGNVRRFKSAAANPAPPSAVISVAGEDTSCAEADTGLVGVRPPGRRP